MKEFTEDEKVIAMHINKKYKWIARNSSGSLIICTRKPIKYEKSWCVGRIDEYNSITEFEHIFKSIRWEDDKPTLIKDIYDPQILDDVERKYIKMVLRPFHDEVEYVEKLEDYLIDGRTCGKQYLFIKLYDGTLTFPDFDAGKMYIGMELSKKYTLKELGITYGGKINE